MSTLAAAGIAVAALVVGIVLGVAMNALAVLGIALLALILGIAIGVRLTSTRYQRTLGGE